MSLSILVAMAVAVLATAVMSGIFGMLGGIILLGLLLMVLSVPAAMSLHAVTQMASTGWRAILWRRFLLWHLLPGYAIGGVASFTLFWALGLVLDKTWVLLGLGLTPFVALAVPRESAPDIRRPGAPMFCGAVVTGLQLVSGVGGPVLDVFFLRSEMDRRAVVATKAVMQTLGHVLKLAYFAPLAMAASDTVHPAVYGVAVVSAIVGNSLGQRVLERMDDRQFRRWAQVAAMGIGGVCLVQAGWAML